MVTIGVNKQSKSVASLDNEFNVTTGFSLVDNTLTFNPVWIGTINNVKCSNPNAVALNIPFTANEDLERIDIAVFTTDNTFVILHGDETTGTPAAPTVPENTLLATFFKVGNSQVFDPAELELQGMMIEKLYNWIMMLSNNMDILSNTVNAQAQGYKTISGNVTLDNTYHNCIIKIASTCMITIPSGLRSDWNAIFDAVGSVTGTFVESGTTFSSPFGKKLSNNSMGSVYMASTNNFRLNGSFTV